MPEGLVAAGFVALSLLFTLVRWLRAPSGLLKTGPEAQPRPPDAAAVVGNYPPPGRRAAAPPRSFGLGDDRWLDWLAIALLFAGFLYAIYLGARPEGKRVL
jgi:hypothetical protein